MQPMNLRSRCIATLYPCDVSIAPLSQWFVCCDAIHLLRYYLLTKQAIESPVIGIHGLDNAVGLDLP